MSSESKAVLDSSIVVASKNQIFSDLVGEAVILDVTSGVYYGLNEVGCSVWNLIQEQKTVKEVRDTLLAEYEVDVNQCNNDLLQLLHNLAGHGLVEFVGEATN